MYYYIYKSPIGSLCFIEQNQFLTHIINLNFKDFNHDSMLTELETPLIKKAYLQILEYLNGYRKEFSIPLNPKGTEFQNKVWKELLNIPYGETRSYKDIAISIGIKNGARAVGNANGKNPILIIIPCHRVISSDGSLGGYSSGLNLKKKFLELESKI